MAYIDYDDKDNSISLFKGIFNFQDKVIFKKINEYYSEIFDSDNLFKGLKINEFLSKLELKGHKAEILFKDLLEKNEIPFLYIGQGPQGLEKSAVLKEKVKSKRPDFLVNLPDMGTIFFDVKCRRKIGFPNTKHKYFQLFLNEIDGLINLHQQLLIPVWVVFIDETEIDSKNLEPTYYFIPITILKKFKEALFDKLTDREKKAIASLRIPYKIMTEIKDEIIFKTGIISISDNIIENFYKNYKGFVRRIEDEIKDAIRKGDLLKTNIASYCISPLNSWTKISKQIRR